MNQKSSNKYNSSASGKNKSSSKPQKHKGSSLRERLLPSILLAIAAPLSVCFVTPFEIFGGNLDEFKFVLSDFLPLCIAIALASAALLFCILLLCRGKVFDTVYGLLFGITLMFFVQSNYLSLGQNSLEGDGTGEGLPIWLLVLNTALWVIIPAASVAVMLLLRKHKDTIRLITVMALAIMIFMSLVSFLTVSLTTDVFSDGTSEDRTEPTDTAEDAKTETSSETDSLGEADTTVGGNSDSTSEDPAETEPEDTADIMRVLTVENLTTFAKKENIIVFIVDRFDKDYYYDYALKDCPEILSELDGFTAFSDYVSLYPRTFPAVTHLITGVETDFSLSRLDYFTKAYKTSPLLHGLKDNGYDINIYTDTYYAYDNASQMAAYTTNISDKAEYSIVNKQGLSLDMLRLSLYRALPLSARGAVGDIRTTTFDKYVVYKTESEPYSTDMKFVYETVTAEDFTLRESDKGYSFIHISGCHLPNLYDDNFEPVKEEDKWDRVLALKQSFKIINRYISEMKRLGVYNDATIIITGDHASIGSDSKDPYYAHMTTLLAKPAGVYEGSFSSSAPISTENILATVRDAAGISSAENDGCENIFEIPENDIRTRRYYFQRMGSSDHEMLVYEITGNGNDFENWIIKDRYFLGKRIYD